MKASFAVFFSCLLFAMPAIADSFLTAQSFPQTFQDMSFTARKEILEEGYQPYAAVYDDITGQCIKNCAYPGLTLKEEQEISNQDTKAALEQSEKYEKQNNKLSVDTQNIIYNISNTSRFCSGRNPNIPAEQKVPRNEPLMGYPRITSPYGPRVLQGKQGFHDGIDYSAVIGTTVYAPADGEIANVWSDSRCGNGVKIKHEDGTKTLYCHLNKALVNKGDKIGAGCPIAETGNTGHSTGPHLHYAMQDSAGKKIDPSEYTKRKN